jgi:hypothetical protein
MANGQQNPEYDGPTFDEESQESGGPKGIVIKRVKRVIEDGTYEIGMALDEDQVHFLLTFVVNLLISKGVASFDDSEIQIDVLKNTSPENMGQA